MGNCGSDDGRPIVLVFDCISLGTHEISTMDGLKLKKAVDELARRLNVPSYYIKDVLYKYTLLDKYSKIRDLNLPDGAVLNVKFSN